MNTGLKYLELLALSLFTIVIGCSHTYQRHHYIPDREEVNIVDIGQPLEEASIPTPAEPELVEDTIPADGDQNPAETTTENPCAELLSDESLEEWVDEPCFKLQIPEVTHIENCKNYYLKKFRRDYLKGLERRQQYQSMIRKKVRERGMPDAVSWIPMVESWFDNSARSPSHAVGLWQLMPSMARQFGLRIDDWIDERKDPERATDAALDLLEYLHERTGCWFLAFAAYHTGEAEIMETIRRCGIRDYWTLCAQKEFRSQTRFFVAAIMALAAIDRDTEKYGVVFPSEEIPKYVGVKVSKQIDIRKFSEYLGVNAKELKNLNPALKRFMTPPDYSDFAIIVPAHCLEKSPDLELSLFQTETDLIEHVIQPGDTLSSISEQYRIPIDTIMSTNHLSEYLIIAGRRLLIPLF